MPWSTSFEDPIILPNGRKLLTLKDAADYVTKLPKKESDLPEWQTAIEVLLLCSRGGPTMMARIGVMKALNRHVERVFSRGRFPQSKASHRLKRYKASQKCPPTQVNLRAPQRRIGVHYGGKTADGGCRLPGS